VRSGESHWRSVIVTLRITFLRQIGAPAKTDFYPQVSLEVQYIESKTFWGDVKILSQACSDALTGKGFG